MVGRRRVAGLGALEASNVRDRPPWKFWHPLPFWHALIIALVAQFVCILPLVAPRELFGIGIPEWLGSGIAGAGMYVAVRAMAQRKLKG